MASKELSILLIAKNMASKTIGQVNKDLGKLGKTGAGLSRGMKIAGAAIAGVGTVAATGIAMSVRSGIESLAALESAVTSVDGAIATMGMTGQVTGQQVAAWANEIEAATGAAFDDKAIVQSTATLIRYGKVSKGNLRPAMEVMTDLAAKTGDVEGASTLLAKALADPAKAAGKLARVGIVLTKQQQKQIKAMVETGKTAEAQALILDELAKSTKGAAAASQGPYKRAMSTLSDVVEDAQKALAEGFLPVLEEVADWLSKGLADPGMMQSIRDFGKGLAQGFRGAVTWARELPWKEIGDGLRTAAGFAKGLIDAFTSMPPQVQATIIALAGLNKLTGGAVTGIIGQLGQGLIKGVLGMTAGVVHLKAASVVGAPGGVGAAPVGGGAAGRLGSFVNGAMKVFMVGAAAAVVAQLAGQLGQQSTELREQAEGVRATAQGWKPESTDDIVAAIRNIDEQMADPFNQLALTITNPLNGAKTTLERTRADLVAKLETMNRATAAGDERTAQRIASLNATINAKDFSPRINVNTGFTVNTNVSVRGMGIAANVRASYNRGVAGSTAGGKVTVS